MGKDNNTKKAKKPKTGGQTGAAPDSCSNNGASCNMQSNTQGNIKG